MAEDYVDNREREALYTAELRNTTIIYERIKQGILDLRTSFERAERYADQNEPPKATQDASLDSRMTRMRDSINQTSTDNLTPPPTERALHASR